MAIPRHGRRTERGHRDQAAIAANPTNASWLRRSCLTPEWEWTHTLLSPGIANGLYCAGGLLLSVVSWRSGWLRGWAGVTGFLTWSVGLSLTVFAFQNHREGVIVSGGLLMALFIPWAAWLGWRMRGLHLQIEN